MASVTITAGSHTTPYSFGVSAYTVTNLGTVSVTSPTAIQFTGTASTLIMAVTAAVTGASYAVVFAAGPASRLILNPGAALTGTVFGGNPIGTAGTATLELAS